MPEKYLIDTCVWRDFYEDRFSKTGNPLGEHATSLFMKIIKAKDTIIFSESLVWELKRDYNENDINDLLHLLFTNKILLRIGIAKEEYKEAKKLAQERDLPFVDCLNAIHARNHNAILVSQDGHFFEKLSDITKPVRPQ